MGTNDCWSYLASLGVHHCTWHDPLLAGGLAACSPLTKIPCIDIDEEDFLHPRVEPITCSAVGCRKTFTTVAEHAAHQRSCHNHACSTCRHSFPSHHLLDLHLLEVHDSLFQLMAEKKRMYQCLLETCHEKFKDPAERKAHCIDRHKFPSNFRFDVSWRKLGKNNNIDDMKTSAEGLSMECEASVTQDEDLLKHWPKCIDATEENTRMKNTNKMVAKNTNNTVAKVPNHFSFGSGVPRGFNRGNRGHRGHGRRTTTNWHQRKHLTHDTKTNIEEVNMKDLEVALVDEAGNL